MLRRSGTGLLAVCAIASTPALAQDRHLSFLACPVAQDMGPDRDFCFFVMHEGVRYGLSGPPDWGNPQLGHQVLVEAVIADKAEECGGVPIDGRVSVMPELSPECDEIAPFRPALRLSGPAPRRKLSEIERAAIAADPSASLQIVRLPPVPEHDVTLGRWETIYFPFESDRASGPDALMMVRLAELAGATPGAEVSIRAYRGATLLDDGRSLVEREGMARQRGEKVANILRGLGAHDRSIGVEMVETPPEADGERDWMSRRVEILVRAGR
ncbi:outer membrane protein OmpA-like peptidoglycan-associated protein [Altererythrobacter atlanticus]|uniref:Uncharacterized protein n=1 Tax=Croceibacterium atlanticum TaxID=1267766 RepID=A0A0F7KN48_9SPHN|nr:hypothetical protein [Croceibacterium atlanticum]AKH41958.1 hypothetical protein WYH_00910 [Croceibacterium atlanticum]MBB5733474.1 outer membrane protein OmpA-like peptidoglycan-associated protein [Croceibacterium atlanticum]